MAAPADASTALAAYSSKTSEGNLHYHFTGGNAPSLGDLDVKVANFEGIPCLVVKDANKRHFTLAININHPNICGVEVYNEAKNEIVIEYVDMTFADYLSKKKSSFFERIKDTQEYEMSREFLLLFRDISRGVQYLHEKKITHGHVKMDNILIKTINKDKVTVKLFQVEGNLEFNAGKKKDWMDLKIFLTDCFGLFGYNMSVKTKLFCAMLSNRADIMNGVVVETHPIFEWPNELKMRCVRFLSTKGRTPTRGRWMERIVYC